MGLLYATSTQNVGVLAWSIDVFPRLVFGSAGLSRQHWRYSIFSLSVAFVAQGKPSHLGVIGHFSMLKHAHILVIGNIRRRTKPSIARFLSRHAVH